MPEQDDPCVSMADQALADKILAACPGEPPWVFGASNGGLELEFENTGSVLIRDGMATIVVLDPTQTERMVRLVKLARQAVTVEGTR